MSFFAVVAVVAVVVVVVVAVVVVHGFRERLFSLARCCCCCCSFLFDFRCIFFFGLLDGRQHVAPETPRGAGQLPSYFFVLKSLLLLLLLLLLLFGLPSWCSGLNLVFVEWPEAFVWGNYARWRCSVAIIRGD